MKSRFDHQEKKLNEYMEEMRATEQRSACLEQDAWQPRLAMEADVPSDTKTRKRSEGAPVAVQAKHGDSCSVNQVDPDQTCLTSFGYYSTGLPALLCSWDDDLVGNGATAPKPFLSALEMRTPTAPGGLLPTGTASTATTTTFDHLSLWFCPNKDISSKT